MVNSFYCTSASVAHFDQVPYLLNLFYGMTKDSQSAMLWTCLVIHENRLSSSSTLQLPLFSRFSHSRVNKMNSSRTYMSSGYSTHGPGRKKKLHAWSPSGSSITAGTFPTDNSFVRYDYGPISSTGTAPLKQHGLIIVIQTHQSNFILYNLDPRARMHRSRCISC